jgi:hypothetical protein
MPCARAKTKCDLQFPCSRCVKRHTEDQCRPPPRSGVDYTAGAIATLASSSTRGAPPTVCVPCRVGKRECDKKTPCSRCVRLKQEEKCIPFAIWKEKYQQDSSISGDSNFPLKTEGNDPAVISGSDPLPGFEENAKNSHRKRKREGSVSSSSQDESRVIIRSSSSKPFALIELAHIAFEEAKNHKVKKPRRSAETEFVTIRDLRVSNNFLGLVPHSSFDVHENFLGNLNFMTNFSPMRISEAILQRNTHAWMLFFMMSSVFSGISNFENHVDAVISASAYPGQPEEEHNQILEKLNPIYSLAPGLETAFMSVWKIVEEARARSPFPSLEHYESKNIFHGITDEHERTLISYLLDEFCFKMAPVDPSTGQQVRIPHMLFRFTQTRFDDDAPFTFYLNQEAVKFTGYSGQEMTYWTDVRDPPLLSSKFSDESAPVPTGSQ